MEGALSFVIFYIAFLLLLLSISVVMPIDLIEGVTEEDIEALSQNVTLPPEPTIVDYVIFPFMFIYDILGKMLVVLSVSSSHQFLSLVIIPFTIGFLFIIISIVRG